MGAVPSPSHALVTAVVSRLRRTPTVTDVDAHRDALVLRNQDRRTSPPRFLARRYDLEVRDVGFPAYVLTPKGIPPDALPARTVLHLHGGSFTSAAASQQWRYADRVAQQADDARLVFPAYPLAPRHTWRDSHDALVRLASELAEETPLVLSGDSAGGGLALAVAQALRNAEGPQPTHLVLLAPWVDLTNSAPGLVEAGRRDPWLNVDNLDTYALFWAGRDDDLVRWEVSPGLGDLHGLPRALAFCGTRDVLLPNCVALEARAAEAGWDLELVVAEGLIHVYPLLPVAEAKPALRRIGEFLAT